MKFSLIQVSLLADLALGSILVFIWLGRREDRHALYWGGGQILLGVTATLWSLRIPGLWMAALNTAICTTGLMGLIVGTRFFCGKPLSWARSLVGWSALWLALMGAHLVQPGIGDAAGVVAFASVFAWLGWRLIARPHAYRLLGLVFFLRTCVHLALAFNMLSSTSMDPALASDFILEIIAVLGMIHAALHESDSRIRATLNGLGHGFLIRDAKGIIRFASQKIADITGSGNADRFVGQHISVIAPSRSPEQSAAWFKHVIAPGAPLPSIDESHHLRKDGVDIPVEIISVPYEDRGEILILSQVIDISERKAQEAARQRAAMLDEPTGLLNRTAFTHLLGQRLARTADDGQAMILLLIDLDHFKRINDTLGHSVGDRLLRLVADRLKALQGPQDMLARFGGDEFVLAVPAPDRANVQEAAERFARSILLALGNPFSLTSSRIALKASIGIALGPGHGLDPESLLSAADTALYAAKDAGRNRYRIFDEGMSARTRDALMIDAALQQAIINKEFTLVYQPIVEARSRRLSKVEALLRWATPALGFVGPDRFIPIAEESGQIIPIGTWVLQEATRQAREWASQPEGPIRIAVNVSAAQLVDPEFMSIVEQSLADNCAAPSEIEIEMTERVLINEADTVVRVIEALHAKGLSTSLDDFGTGYSSLSYLARFHLRTLKIDRAFVNGIERDARNLALVRAIIAMGHSLGMEIVAEGVETAEQADVLTELGCKYLQGYLFSRPVPADQVRRRPA
jgi:diguanylate cyclase (GGDEF)-like protein/PAS domain S-box-containing protein